MGLMAQDLSLLPLLVVRLQRYFFLPALFIFTAFSSVALTPPFPSHAPREKSLQFLPLWLRHAGTCRHRLLTWLFYDHAKHTALGGLCLCTLTCAWMCLKYILQGQSGKGRLHCERRLLMCRNKECFTCKTDSHVEDVLVQTSTCPVFVIS